MDEIEIKKEQDEKEYKDSLKSLGLTEKDVEDKSLFSNTPKKNISEKVTKINDMAISYKMTLMGKTYSDGASGYKQTGKAIAGRKFIDLTYSILNSYTEESNLLTKKDIDKFNIQFIDAFRKVNNFVLRDRSITEKDSRIIVKLFKDKLCNTGDIITGSQGNMERVFNKYDDELMGNSGMNNLLGGR